MMMPCDRLEILYSLHDNRQMTNLLPSLVYQNQVLHGPSHHYDWQF